MAKVTCSYFFYTYDRKNKYFSFWVLDTILIPISKALIFTRLLKTT